jgi:ABC-type multidrug transport system ATPase subunit
VTDPLLSCSDLRVDRLGLPEVDALTCATAGNHVWIVGAPEALFRAAAGQLLPVRGQIRVFGSRPRSALERTEIATVHFGASLESPLSVLDYCRSSAELAGVPKARRDVLAREAIARTKLETFTTMKLAKASLLVRRGALLAGALATGAPTLVLSDPAEGLETDVARGFARTVAQAIDDKSYLMWKGRARTNDPSASFADEALVFSGSTVVAQGPPEEIASSTRTFVLRVEGAPDASTALIAALEERGAKIDALGPAAFRLTLPEGTGTRAVFEAADGRDATVTELSPIAAGFD